MATTRQAKVQQVFGFAWVHQQHSDRENGMSPTVRKVVTICSPFKPSDHILMGKWRANFDYHTDLQCCWRTWSNDEEYLLPCGSSKPSLVRKVLCYTGDTCASIGQHMLPFKFSPFHTVCLPRHHMRIFFLSNIIIFLSGISFWFLLRYLSI
jgi:hypothetical protein